MADTGAETGTLVALGLLTLLGGWFLLASGRPTSAPAPVVPDSGTDGARVRRRPRPGSSGRWRWHLRQWADGLLGR